jgi:hypothetical protein
VILPSYLAMRTASDYFVGSFPGLVLLRLTLAVRVESRALPRFVFVRRLADWKGVDVFHGFVSQEQCAKFLMDCDVLVLPSLCEATAR